MTGFLSLFSALLLVAAPAFSIAQGSSASQDAKDPGLLFYLSGEHGFKGRLRRERQETIQTSSRDVKILPGGAQGKYLQCGDNQLLSYWAPGNIFSQRGTLSFYWRSRDAVDETEFPIFRVGYGDHSSWDMVWLRIDYNGHGFDAFVNGRESEPHSHFVHDAQVSCEG